MKKLGIKLKSSMTKYKIWGRALFALSIIVLVGFILTVPNVSAQTKLSYTGNRVWHQDTAYIQGSAEIGDWFGEVLATGDFNGDGADDIAIGSPNEDVGNKFDAGAVNVIYGKNGLVDPQVKNQLLYQGKDGISGTPEQHDEFGAALAVGDFNGDRYDDLAIGVPGEQPNGGIFSGEVHILYGSSSGLRAAGINGTFSRNSLMSYNGVAIIGAENDHNAKFGFALAAGNFNGDKTADGIPIDDLAVGCPGDNLFGWGWWNDNKGSVSVLFGSEDGITAEDSMYLTQDDTWIKETAEGGDFFGYSLAAGNFNGDKFDDLAVGSPGESLDPFDVSGSKDHGVVHILYGTKYGSGFELNGSFIGLTEVRNKVWHQNTPDIIGSGGLIKGMAETFDSFGTVLAAGNFNGDKTADGTPIDDLAVGVPNEGIGNLDDAGAVNVIYGSEQGLTTVGNEILYQGADGVNGTAQAEDMFGFSLATGDINNDGRDDLAIGVPFESISGKTKAGYVYVRYGSVSGLTSSGDQGWYQNSYGIESDCQDFEYFGYSLAMGDFDGNGHADLAVGVPVERVNGKLGAGMINVIYSGYGQ